MRTETIPHETGEKAPKETDRPIRALLDVIGGQRNALGNFVDRIPPKEFGTGKSRHIRKLVLVAIAASANPDGSNSYPSVETIAHRALCSTRTVFRTVEWWNSKRKGTRLRIETKGVATSRRGRTNLYSIVFPELPDEKKHSDTSCHSVKANTLTNPREHCDKTEGHTLTELCHTTASKTAHIDRPKQQPAAAPHSEHHPGEEKETAVPTLTENMAKRWSAMYGGTVAPFPSKARADIVDLARQHSEATVLTAWESFLADSSDWLAANRHPVRAFVKQFDSYAARSGDSTIADTADHAEREARQRKRFEKAVREFGAKNVRFDEPHAGDEMAVMVLVCGEWIPPETADYVREQHAAMERAKRDNNKKEVERRLDEALREKYGLDFPPPSEAFDRECEEIRQQIIAGTIA